MNEDYLKLFDKILKQDNEEFEQLNETPNYNKYQNLEKNNNYQNYNLNEVNREDYTINENVNDAWTNNIVIETRINGQVARKGNINPDPYVQRRNRHINETNDVNGLNQFLEDDNLNEIVRHNKIKNNNNNDDMQMLKESNLTYKNEEIITHEIWQRWCQSSIYPLALNIKGL